MQQLITVIFVTVVFIVSSLMVLGYIKWDSVMAAFLASALTGAITQIRK